MKIIKEFFHPSSKCLRKGHRNKIAYAIIRKSSTDFREIVADYDASVSYCSRCGNVELRRIIGKIEGFTGCEMPNKIWAEMKEKGFVVIKIGK